MNEWLAGLRIAFQDYPFDNIFRWIIEHRKKPDYKQFFECLMDVYKQHKQGKISQEDIIWVLGKIYETMYSN